MDTPSKKVVCIIDDDPYIQEIYQLGFAKAGYPVVLAQNGEEGLRIVREKKPDIILLDLMMPIMDGPTFLNELKKDPALSQIPVIVMSNMDDETVLKEAFSTNASRLYLVKAYTTPQKAIEAVQKVLG